MSKYTPLPIAERVANQQTQVDVAGRNVASIQLAIGAEYARADRKREEPNQEILARLDDELSVATTVLENLESVLIGVKAMQANPPVRLLRVAA